MRRVARSSSTAAADQVGKDVGRKVVKNLRSLNMETPHEDPSRISCLSGTV
jgi:hypothetical protein